MPKCREQVFEYAFPAETLYVSMVLGKLWGNQL